MADVKSILLHVDASPRCAARLKMAADLAERLDATVRAAYAATPSAMMLPVAMGVYSGLVGPALELDEDLKRRARAIFDAAAVRPRINWDDLSNGFPTTGFVRAALASDLMMLGQHDRSDASNRLLPADFVEAVLIDSGKPAIVVPYAGQFPTVGQRVLVAWKPTRESARALAASLPLLSLAQEVHVAAWGDDPHQVAPFLLRHGIDARLHAEPAAARDVGELMLSRAADLGADLLVMGCYGHGRARELVLGGASRTVLDSMTLPVLMAH